MVREREPSAGADDDAVEIEWQFDALDLRPVERWLATLPLPPSTGRDLPTVTAQAKPSRRLVDHYLDTEDWRFARAGFVLRTRHRGRHDEATLKDTRPVDAGGLRQRLEVTQSLATGGVADLGPDGPVGRRIHAVAGRRPLRQVLEVRTRRRPFSLRVAGEEIAELALDETAITVTGDERPVRLRRVEVEVPAEVAGEWVEKLEPLVGELRRSCGLQPASLSKFEAGLLALGVSVPGPVDLGPTAVGPDTSVGDLAYAVIRRQLAVLFARESGTRLGENIEDLHDMRVATRRLRAALDLFAQVLPVRSGALRSELAWLADRLGAVRDLDVQLERMDQMTEWTSGWTVQGAGADRAGDSALEHLGRLLETERDGARAALLGALDSARWERLASNLTTLVSRPPVRRPPGFGTPAAAVAFELVESRHRVVLKAARRAVRSGRPGDFHRLRIRCKRLRYSLEFTADLYGGRTEAFTRHLAKVQDSLGQMQDAEVATTRLAALATAGAEVLPPSTVFVMGGVAERYRGEAAALLERMPRRLRVLNGKAWEALAEVMARRQDQTLAVVPVRAVPAAPNEVAGPTGPLAPSDEEPAIGGGTTGAGTITTTAAITETDGTRGGDAPLRRVPDALDSPEPAPDDPAAAPASLPGAAAALAAWPDPAWGPPAAANGGSGDHSGKPAVGIGHARDHTSSEERPERGPGGAA